MQEPTFDLKDSENAAGDSKRWKNADESLMHENFKLFVIKYGSTGKSSSEDGRGAKRKSMEHKKFFDAINDEYDEGTIAALKTKLMGPKM